MNIPFFSVVIPLYNKEKYITNAINSILNQDFNDFEIIIVNDGSTDNSLEQIKSLLSDKVRLIEHNKNKGLSAARNTGIKNAKANYIAFLDADDLWLHGYLSAIKNLINLYSEAKIFATSSNDVYPNKTYKTYNSINNVPKNYIGIVDYFKENLKQGLYTACSVCYHKTVFESIGYFDQNLTFSEEIDFNIRVNLKFKLAYDSKVYVNYFMEIEGQLSSNNILNKVVPNYDEYDKYCESNLYLKKYLDFERYVLAKHLKVDGDKIKHQLIISKIDFKNLNYKQQLLLKFPTYILRIIRFSKKFLARKGFKLTSYDS